MAKNSKDKKGNSQSSKNIQIPPIRKQTAGAVAGAAAGSIAGPIGAVVGGVVGAAVGKAAEKGQPIAPAASRTVRSAMKGPKAISKTARRLGASTKSSAKRRKSGSGAGKAKKTVSRRPRTAKSGKTSGSRGQKRSGSRRKRH
jgi:outer membrane lipoprotein SlyB